jgi:N-acetylglucosamine kinase-like BadF-type ATPase
VEEAAWARRRWAEAIVEAVATGRAEPAILAPVVSALLAGGDVDVARRLLEEASRRVSEGPAADEIRRMLQRLEQTYPGVQK